MTMMNVRFRSIPDTHAALGWVDGRTVVIDRAEGRAGGMGLGFNGGELLGLAIGGCFCNDLHYVATEMGIAIASVDVDVELSLAGEPMLVTHAAMRVHVRAVDAGANIEELIRRARADSTVSNSIQTGIAVEVVAN